MPPEESTALDGACIPAALVTLTAFVKADVRQFLSLQLVPARNRQRLCGQRYHRGRPRNTLTRGAIEVIDTPSNSGKGQKIARCPACHVALWSHCSGSGTKVSFVRVGTLDNPAQCIRPTQLHLHPQQASPGSELPARIFHALPRGFLRHRKAMVCRKPLPPPNYAGRGGMMPRAAQAPLIF